MLVKRYHEWQQRDRLRHPGTHLLLGVMMLIVAGTQIPGLVQLGWSWLPVIVIIGSVVVATNEWVQLWLLHRRRNAT